MTSTGTRQQVTYCRLCEPLCGLVATVEDGRLVSLRPDDDHPLSRGKACPRGIAFTEVQNDPDRVLHPLRRTPDGGFEQVTWDEALDDIAARLGRIWREHGAESIGHYLGNPSAFTLSASLWTGLFLSRLGATQQYTVGSQDVNSRFVASKLLYGAASQVPFPDVPRTDLLLVLGANPFVSQGSALRAPRIKQDLRDVVARGGRVVVVDPRRSETARAFEHVPVRPDTDAWLLLSLLHVVFAEGLADHTALAEQTTGADALQHLAARFPPEQTAERTGVPAGTVRELARAFATAPSAAAYGRTGACLGSHGTLVSFLLDALTIVTGNLDRPGGSLFTRAVLPVEHLGELSGQMTYASRRSRVGGLPDVMGTMPATVMAEEITTPGPGQLRALLVTAGNPVITVPDGDRLEAALDQLDLLVSVDLYVTDTNRHAHYVLPGTTWLERDDVPFAFAACSPTVFAQSTEAVLEPAGEARQEWEVYDELARRMGISLLAAGPLARFDRLVRALLPQGRLTPRRLADVLLRLGPYGDRFGLRRGGLSLKRLAEHPHGVVLEPHAPTGLRRQVVRHRDARVRLDPPEVLDEARRLGSRHRDDPAFPLRLIGLRELRSQNSWMHNSATLMKGAARRHTARIHPDDAARADVRDGQRVRLVSAHGAVETEALLTDEVSPGTVASPHGWGHRGGSWQRANAAGGANTNQLMSSDPADLERLAGMALLNGVPVRIEACP